MRVVQGGTDWPFRLQESPTRSRKDTNNPVFSAASELLISHVFKVLFSKIEYFFLFFKDELPCILSTVFLTSQQAWWCKQLPRLGEGKD